MKKEWFVISNLEEFIEKTRYIVYDNFGSWKTAKEDTIRVEPTEQSEIDELNSILSYKESYSIIEPKLKKQKHKNQNRYRYLLSDRIFIDIIKDLNSRMISNLLTNLVNKGLVESAYDSETNDFIFWIKDNEKKNTEEKPETD